MTSVHVRWLFATTIAACARHPSGSATQPEAPPVPPPTDATAVFDQVYGSTDAPPEGLLIPVNSPWGNLAPIATRHRIDYRPEGFVIVAATTIYSTGGTPEPLDAVPTPAIVRLHVELPAGAAPTFWPNAIKSVDRVDETSAAPLDLTAILDDARRRWDVYAAQQAAALATALEAASAATPGQPFEPETLSDDAVFVPSWSAGQLTVIYGRHIGRTSQVLSGGHVGCGKYDRPLQPERLRPIEIQPSPCPPQIEPITVTMRSYGADVALIATYDRTGRLVDERHFPAHAAAAMSMTP